ncbi:hypothetical protein Gotri_023432 [Gossypium trilobum]|uniref:Major facilitator superfamily (MFS) profile domain-containing protein n=1 Tax=Gossypium trilobum TaxID=34281 RepID=A0A7J9DJR8_9ROSI|nr:hypothetical protein [Gossypium trilobum]
MAEEGIYKEDGTTDFRNKPAVKHKTGTWKACPYILGNECCERLAFYGINTNLVNYLKFQLNQRNVTAVSNVTNWSGMCYVMPLIGALFADAYLGRYWTIASFSISYVFVSSFRIGVFFLGLYLIAFGTVGIKPCVSSFGADQFDDSDETEKKQKSSFFNWFYFSINIGALVASSVLVWIQTNIGWGWGFGIPAVAMAIAVVSFFSGTKLYRNQRPGGSPLTRIFQVMVASVGKARVEVPNDKSLLHFFDKAAVVTSNDQTKGSINPWKLCTITQIEELKSIIRLLLIWATGCAEVFTFIGQLEFFYGQAPDAMRSLCSALSLTTAALGNYLSTFLVNIVADFSTRDGDYGWMPNYLNYGHLHYFFWLLAVLSVLNLGVYLMVARWYTFKKAPI